MCMYFEPIQGDVYRFPVTQEGEGFRGIDVSSYDGFSFKETELFVQDTYRDGSNKDIYHCPFGIVYADTEEWQVKYQDSLFQKVSQGQVKVYFLSPIKRGKVNTRALVIDANGVCYTTLVPTFPAPRLGESFTRLRMDLELVSIVPRKEFLVKVTRARKKDPTLI